MYVFLFIHADFSYYMGYITFPCGVIMNCLLSSLGMWGLVDFISVMGCFSDHTHCKDVVAAIPFRIHFGSK